MVKGGCSLRREDLREEIERLRQELYRISETSNSSTEMLQVSQKLDQLILIWMDMQKKEYEQRKACNQ